MDITRQTNKNTKIQTSVHASHPLQNFEKSLFKDFIAC
jgi:hypothetical protein